MGMAGPIASSSRRLSMFRLMWMWCKPSAKWMTSSACNHALQALVGDGIALRFGGRIAATDRESDIGLQEVISALLRSEVTPGSPRIELSRGENRLPLLVEAIPIAGTARDVYAAARLLLLV